MMALLNTIVGVIVTAGIPILLKFAYDTYHETKIIHGKVNAKMDALDARITLLTALLTQSDKRVNILEHELETEIDKGNA